jgi:hypothetical protein
VSASRPSPVGPRRIFAEHIAPATLGDAATVGLLSRYGLQALVAVPPGAESGALGEALARLSRTEAGVGVWPLLDDADGYWPSDGNAAAFTRRVQDVLSFARAAGATVRTVVVDLEPPLWVMERLMGPRPVSAVARRVYMSCRATEAVRRRSAAQVLARLQEDLHRQGLETFATVIPPVVLDHPRGPGLWQAVFQTQVHRPGWSKICPMLYTSIMADLLPSGAAGSARALAHVMAARLVRHAGPRAAGALGLTGTGKLEGEPVLPDPEALAEDVAAIRAAGVEDLALFSLEGVLARPAPEAWLQAFTCTEVRAPAWWARAAWRAGLMWGQTSPWMGRMLPVRV